MTGYLSNFVVSVGCGPLHDDVVAKTLRDVIAAGAAVRRDVAAVRGGDVTGTCGRRRRRAVLPRPLPTHGRRRVLVAARTDTRRRRRLFGGRERRASRRNTPQLGRAAARRRPRTARRLRRRASAGPRRRRLGGGAPARRRRPGRLRRLVREPRR